MEVNIVEAMRYYRKCLSGSGDSKQDVAIINAAADQMLALADAYKEEVKCVQVRYIRKLSVSRLNSE